MGGSPLYIVMPIQFVTVSHWLFTGRYTGRKNDGSVWTTGSGIGMSIGSWACVSLGMPITRGYVLVSCGAVRVGDDPLGIVSSYRSDSSGVLKAILSDSSVRRLPRSSIPELR